MGQVIPFPTRLKPVARRAPPAFDPAWLDGLALAFFATIIALAVYGLAKGA